MLIGEYTHNLDIKGRISIPVKFRSELGSSAIVTRGLDNCLFIYPKGQWEIMVEKIASLPVSSSKARAFSRHMLSGAMEVEIDKLGRMLVPGFLRDFAGVKKETVLAGVNDRIEMWSKKAWDEYRKTTEAEVSTTAEDLSELGI